MEFAWSQEQEELRDAILDFARGALNDGLRERDDRAEFNRSGWEQSARAGVHGLPIPEKYGGMGLDALTTVGVLERFGYGCEDNGLSFSINAHMWTVAIPVLHFGSPLQKEKLLKPLCDGSLIGGNAMSEPESGSDAYSLSTTARLHGDRYLLNGNKIYVTNGSVADVFVVYANTDVSGGKSGITAFLVNRNSPGFEVLGEADKMGIRTSPMATLYLDNCEVPVGDRLGSEGDGIALFNHSMTWERACILASAVGSMGRLLDKTVQYAKMRKQFGQKIGKFQMVGSKIVEMKLCVETARALLYRAAWLRDRGRSIFSEAALAKLHISESWVRCAEHALQIHGAYGYMKESGIERELRDAYASRIYSGTSEIQKVLISAMMGL